MFIVLYFCLTLSFCMLQVKSQAPEAYTWEDYDGKNIPEKAFSITDDQEKPVYIGMGKYKKTNCTGDLLEGATEITVQCYGVRKVKNNLKILTVEDKTQWKWVKTSYTTLQDDVNVEDLVKSNYDESLKDFWYIGRTKAYDGTAKSGHASVGIGLFFIFNGTQKMISEDYEVMVQKKEEATKPKDPSKKSCPQLLDEVKATAAGAKPNVDPECLISGISNKAKDVKEVKRTPNTV